MKKAASIVLVFIFLSGNTELHEFLKLPILLHHYLEHRAENQMSFAEFLNEHYAGVIRHSDGAHHDHERLPLKTTDCSTVFLFADCARQIDFFIVKINVPCEELLAVKPVSFISSAVLKNVWQPPRF